MNISPGDPRPLNHDVPAGVDRVPVQMVHLVEQILVRRVEHRGLALPGQGHAHGTRLVDLGAVEDPAPREDHRNFTGHDDVWDLTRFCDEAVAGEVTVED